MYDPARDSWNDPTDERRPSRAEPVVVAEVTPQPAVAEVSTTPADTTKTTPAETAPETAPAGIAPTQPVSAETVSVEPLSAEVSKQLDGSGATDKPATTNELPTASQSLPDKKEPSPDSLVVAPASLPDPPRKLKKPSTRVNQEDRDKQTAELRTRIEKRGSDDGPDSNEPDRKRHVESVRSHYNERPNTSQTQRQKSPIISLRKFNNLIKSVLIGKYVRRRDRVLDIGCGKGGDLLKWTKQGIDGLIGIDIADRSIEQAKDRYEELRKKVFWSDFCVGDAFAEPVEDIVHPEAFPVDVVSIQFTLHYSFGSEDRARMLLSNVSRVLKRDGMFIGTMPDSDVLLSHIRRLPKNADGTTAKEWGNRIYRVRFYEEPPTEFPDVFGYKYDFFLEDAVGNVAEYVVPFEAFTKLAAEYNLELVERKQFLDMFDVELDRNRRYAEDLCRTLKVYKQDGSFGIEGDEREAAGIYTTFAFRKV